jgi:hypothetical protein
MDKEVLLQYLKEIESSYQSLTQYIEEKATDEEYNDFYENVEILGKGIGDLNYWISKNK